MSRTEKILRRWPWWVALVLAVTVLVVGVPAYQQWRAIDWIDGHGGESEIESGWLRNAVPDSIADALDRKFQLRWSLPFDRVVGVDFRGAMGKGSFTIELQRLRNLKQLERIDNWYLESNADLRYLERLPALKSLTIEGDFTEESVRFLKEKLRLKNLEISGNLTDSHFRILAEMDGIESLAIESNVVTDEGLKYLSRLTNLKRLEVNHVGITDKGVAYLKGLPKLFALSLSETSVTDEGLPDLREMPALLILGLDETSVSIKGIQKLEGMSQLEWLLINNTKVTRAEADHLRETFPDTKVLHSNERSEAIQ